MCSTIKAQKYALTLPILGDKEALFIAAEHLIILAVNVIVRYFTHGVRNPDGLVAFRIVEKIPDSTFLSVPDSFIVAVYLHALRRQAPQVCVLARSRYPHISVAIVVSVNFDCRPKVCRSHIRIWPDCKQAVKLVLLRRLDSAAGCRAHDFKRHLSDSFRQNFQTSEICSFA